MPTRFAICLSVALAVLRTAQTAGAQQMVVLNQRSDKYHHPTCPSVKACKNCIEIPITQAVARHAVPCGTCVGLAGANHGRIGNRSRASVVLDGAEVPVHWTDGDTFKRRDHPVAKGVRIVGYNTLESYGPVHRWGTWAPLELLALAKRAGAAAQTKPHHCASTATTDRYGRGLARCPTLALELVGQGLAMVFAVDELPEPELVKTQAAAQRQRLGMWAKGIPSQILTSIHSVDEVDAGGKRGGRAYNRIVDTRTGLSRTIPHETAYRDCTEVCMGSGDDRTCMLYVPYERRYGKTRATCLR